MKAVFIVPGEPQGKGRPRFARAGNQVRTFTPAKTAAYENLVKLEYERQCGGKRFGTDTMLVISIFAYYGIPKSVSKKKREQMIAGILRPIKKPDMDNVVKVIADSLNGVAYRDDTQIVTAVVEKYYAEDPRVEITITEVKT